MKTVQTAHTKSDSCATSSSNPHVKRQRGAALVVALLVVALVTAIATSMGSDYLITVKRASNLMISEQSYSYLRGAEVVAMKVLRDDVLLGAATTLASQLTGGAAPPPGFSLDPSSVDLDETVDTCDEMWATEAPPFMLEDGTYGGRIHDLQGRFNLNVLAGPAAQQNRTSGITVHEARFMRLLQTFEDVEVSIEEAESITQALLDYLDPDSEAEGFGGAEASYYASVEGRKPHRPANRMLVDTSELLLVAGMKPKLYKALLPHITVWPQSSKPEVAAININTATLNVLRSLNVPSTTTTNSQGNEVSRSVNMYGLPLTEDEVKPMQLAQFTGGFAKVEDFKAVCQQASGDACELKKDEGVSVKSDYFMLNAQASIGDLTTRLYSVVRRSINNQTKTVKLQVISRSISGSSVIESCVPPETEDGEDEPSWMERMSGGES